MHLRDSNLYLFVQAFHLAGLYAIFRDATWVPYDWSRQCWLAAMGHGKVQYAVQLILRVLIQNRQPTTTYNRLLPQSLCAFFVRWPFPHGKKLMTLTHRQVARQWMEHQNLHYIVDLQIPNHIEDPSQIPVCILPARLLPVKTYPTVRNKVQVELPLFLIANLSTPSKNRRFASEISPNLLWAPSARLDLPVALQQRPHRSRKSIRWTYPLSRMKTNSFCPLLPVLLYIIYLCCQSLVQVQVAFMVSLPPIP